MLGINGVCSCGRSGSIVVMMVVVVVVVVGLRVHVAVGGLAS